MLSGFLPVALLLGGGLEDYALIALGAAGLWAVGTIDDRIAVRPAYRVAASGTLALLLWANGLGWNVTSAEAVNLGLTLGWTVGLVNAFNLLDNIDGATGVTAAVSGGGIGVLAVIQGDTALAALAFTMAGACIGFLRHNLASPARIFLGDGGSMPIGFVIAAAAMSLPQPHAEGLAVVLVAMPLVGVPILDTTLVTISRARRRISLLTGGRDHTTHRLLPRLGHARAVAFALGAAQAVLCGAVIAASQVGEAALVAVGLAYLVVLVVAVVIFESPAWAPPAPAPAPSEPLGR